MNIIIQSRVDSLQPTNIVYFHLSSDHECSLIGMADTYDSQFDIEQM